MTTMTDEELFEVCKPFIQCDTCGERSPKNRCSRCHMNYYCDKKCQSQHWKAEHRGDCKPIKEMRTAVMASTFAKGTSLEVDEEVRKAVIEKDPNCAICLEEMVKPVVLAKCKHAYCSSCLQHWNEFQTHVPTMEEIMTDGAAVAALPRQKSTCPLCREEVPNMAESLISDTALLLAAATRKDAAAMLREENCSRALENMEKLADLQGNDSTKYYHQLLLFRYEIYMLQGNLEKALEAARESEQGLKEAAANGAKIDELMARAEQSRDDPRLDMETERILNRVHDHMKKPYTKPSTHADAVLRVASVQLKLRDWDGAKRTYQDVMQLYPGQFDMTPQQHREIFTSMSQCAYELGKYDIAISLGEGAIEMNRYYPWCHKYVVLALKADGQQDKAREQAAQAVIYETPWDEDHRAEVRAFYREHFE